jgi:hypothetical protein
VPQGVACRRKSWVVDLAWRDMEIEMSVDRVQMLERLYEHGQNSDLVDLTLEKLFTYELHSTERELELLQQDLAEFEDQYGLSSAEFYARFQAGQMGDAIDFVEWASLHQMAERLRKRVDLLTQGSR